MNKSDLAKLMLEYEDVKRKCDQLEQEIKDAVMYFEESIEVGNVRATLRAGRKTYDYEMAAVDPRVTPEIVLNNSDTKINWKAVCEEAGIKDIPFDVSEPSVFIKLLDS